MRISVPQGSHIDKFLTDLYINQSIEVNFNKFVEKEFSNYVLICTYYRYKVLGDYELVFRSEKKMTEFLLKWG